MEIEFIVLASFILTAITVLIVSLYVKAKTGSIEDYLPIGNDESGAKVNSENEFGASTVATTISLATVILAFSDLAGYFGLWLLWPVVTTTLGIWVVYIFAPIIWERISSFELHKPSIHEFLGYSFGSNLVRKIASLCTSLGFVGALAVELSVGGGLVSHFIPAIPSWLAYALISIVGVLFTGIGGFRSVIVTDKIQLYAIWIAIIALALLVCLKVYELGYPTKFLSETPVTIYDFSYREGLLSFLVGIFIINVPTFLSDMSVWQRIAGSKSRQVVSAGLKKSIAYAAGSWGLLAILSCFFFILTPKNSGENPLFSFLGEFDTGDNPLTGVLIFAVFTGLFSATLSTASTQLIASGHTIYIDLVRQTKLFKLGKGFLSELTYSRIVLFTSAIISVVLIETLQQFGFAISDLVFAIFGAQLCLVPAVILALSRPQTTLIAMGKWVPIGLLFGFISGWLSAIYGKYVGDSNFVFLSPVVSLLFSSAVIFTATVVSRLYNRNA